MRERVIVILLFALLAIAVGCGTKKKSVERVVERGKISYALPGRTEISLRALCDTLNRTFLRVDNGPVVTRTEYVQGEPRIIIEHDTIYRDRIKYVDRFVEVENTKEVVDWKWTWWAFVAGFILMWIRPWESILKKLM